jgi:FlaA1/EpsC-like NDP-sugar epimerase
MKDFILTYFFRKLENKHLIPDWLVDFLSSRVKNLYKKHSVPRGIVFAIDSLAVYFVFLFAYLLRFNFDLSAFDLKTAFLQGLLALFFYALSSLFFKSYAGLIRYTTVADILKVFMSSTYAFVILLVISLISRKIYPDEILVIPVSIIIIHYFSITIWHFFVRINIQIVYNMVTSTFSEKKKVLIFGAGEMGAIVKRVIQSDENCNYQVTGFLDDNRNLHGKKLDGIEVFDPLKLTQSFIEKLDFNALIIAIKDLPPARKSSIMQEALDLGLEVLEPPSVDTWLNGNFQARKFQKVKLEDLLGREPIRLSMRKIEMDLRGKIVMVTGAAGSIGSEIVRQLTRFNVGNLILIDQAETPMFILENELRKQYSKCSMQLILSDVTNSEKMELIFKYYRPDIVFHAAAYKHVPLMEENPHEAIRVNVGGTLLLSGLAKKYNVGKFVMISTDKAVNPTNIMGASKRICEMTVQLMAKDPSNNSRFIITRFGNVLGSNGSVIPIFRKQIEDGGPVTVTHPEMTRYFMTIPEACQLVLEAGCIAKGGEIFVFDMGNPVKIADLATQMIRLSGLVPDKDIKIVYTGLRPGEKLYEELFSEGEKTRPTHHHKIRIATVDKVKNGDMMDKILWLLENLYLLSKDQVVEKCHEIVPEYKSSNGHFKVYTKIAAKTDMVHR